MSDATPTLPDANLNRHPSVHAGAFVFWLLMQLLALGLSAGRFPLSSRFPKSGEQFAVIVMIVTQILSVSLLCPLLLRDLRATLLAIAIAWPMVELSAFLADAPLARAAYGEAYVSLWTLALMLWIRALPGSRSRLFAGAVASLLAIAGPLLWYLRAEFVLESPAVNWPRLATLGPIMGSISLIVPDHPPAQAWWFPTAALCCGFIVLTTSIIHQKILKNR